jgi:hypothetical protein
MTWSVRHHGIECYRTSRYEDAIGHALTYAVRHLLEQNCTVDSLELTILDERGRDLVSPYALKEAMREIVRDVREKIAQLSWDLPLVKPAPSGERPKRRKEA